MRSSIIESDAMILLRDSIANDTSKFFNTDDCIYFVKDYAELDMLQMKCDELIIRLDYCNGYLSNKYLCILLALSNIIDKVKPNNYCAYLSTYCCLLQQKIDVNIHKLISMYYQAIQDADMSINANLLYGIRFRRDGYINAHKVI